MQLKLSRLAHVVSLAVALAALSATSPAARAAVAPANDVCSGATVIPAAGPFPYVSPVIPDMRAATVAENLMPPCAIGVTNGVWYRFSPAATALYTFSTGLDTATTLFDPVIAIFTGSSCAGPFPEFACNDDAGGPNNRAALSVNMTQGATYYILVWIGSAEDLTDTNRTFALQLRVSKPVTPLNDSCAGAELIPTGAVFPYTNSVTDTTVALSDNDETASCTIGYRGIWYRFTPPTTDVYIFSTGSDTLTTVDDTALAIYRNTNGCGGTFDQIHCSANGLGRAVTSTTLSNGVTYFIQVWDEIDEYIPGETLVQLRVSKATAPTIVTLGASSIASTGALLTASINPNGVLSRYWFEWGPTTSYGSTSTVRVLLPGTTTVTNSIAIGGYAPNALVHYRAVGTNSIERSSGLDRTFYWTNVPPRLLGGSGLPGGSYQLTFPGVSRQVYVVEGSTNLVTWVYLGPANETTPGQFRFVQPGALANRHQFFRARMP